MSCFQPPCTFFFTLSCGFWFDFVSPASSHHWCRSRLCPGALCLVFNEFTYLSPKVLLFQCKVLCFHVVKLWVMFHCYCVVSLFWFFRVSTLACLLSCINMENPASPASSYWILQFWDAVPFNTSGNLPLAMRVMHTKSQLYVLMATQQYLYWRSVSETWLIVRLDSISPFFILKKNNVEYILNTNTFSFI